MTKTFLLALITLSACQTVTAAATRECSVEMTATSLLSRIYIDKPGHAGQIGKATYFTVSNAWKEKAGISTDERLVDQKKFDAFVADGKGVLFFETKMDADQALRLKTHIRELAKGSVMLPSATAYLPMVGTYIGLTNELIAQLESSRRIGLGELAGRIFQGDSIGLHLRAFRDRDNKPVVLERWIHIHPYQDDRGRHNVEVTELSKCAITFQ